MARVSIWYVRAALLHFLAGVSIGTWQLVASADLLPDVSLMLRSVHVELLLLGWLVQLAVGVATWILPFSGAVSSDSRLWSAWSMLNGGVFLVIAGAWTETIMLRVLGRGGEVIAVLLLTWALWSRLRPLPRRHHD